MNTEVELMNNIKLYRKRYIPDETVYLKNDEIISADDEKIITKWNVLKKRDDFSHGASCYFLKKGIKVSKFINKEGNIIYWYCDIVDYEYNRAENSYLFKDLLIDVIVYPNGFVKVLDMDEIAEAMEMGKIDDETVKSILKRTSLLLNDIYCGNFDIYVKCIKDI